MSSVQNPGLVVLYRGLLTTQLYRGYNKPSMGFFPRGGGFTMLRKFCFGWSSGHPVCNFEVSDHHIDLFGSIMIHISCFMGGNFPKETIYMQLANRVSSG